MFCGWRLWFGIYDLKTRFNDHYLNGSRFSAHNKTWIVILLTFVHSVQKYMTQILTFQLFYVGNQSTVNRFISL